MDPECGKVPGSPKKDSWKIILVLAFQSLGVVYGDLSIAPLYVISSTFSEDILHSESNVEVLGVLSCIFWTLTLITLFKYIFIVLRADDNGQGGTFALYSLICRHANVSLLPNVQVADAELSTYKLESPRNKDESRIKQWLECHKNIHIALLLVVMLGTCMVIGDGVLTPALSVLSAVSGLEHYIADTPYEYSVVPVTCVVILGLFTLQHYGTHRVGFIFAPIVLVWLLCISALGVYNIIHWNPQVYQALSPYQMFTFLKKTKGLGWLSFGGIILCISGSEAMFADLGHLSYTSIQIGFTSLVYPALVLSYMGQAAYLSKHHQISTPYQIGFYASVPEIVKLPVLIIAILASIVGSQSIISGTFSIINQSHSLGCFPRVKVVHTSEKIHGQIYIPEINWMLMILCIVVVFGFRDARHMSNASGLAVTTVMLVTTCLTSLVIILCWKKNVILGLAFLLFFGSIESLFFSATLVKFGTGAWFPILLALILMAAMSIWHYATSKKYEFDLHNKVPLDWLFALNDTVGSARVPGIGIFYTDIISGVPSNFSRFITSFPSFHRILVFVCIKYVPVPFVPRAERYLVGRMGPAEHRCYRCIVRYGYRDVHQVMDSFECELISSLAHFIQLDSSYKDCQSNKSSGVDECRLTVVGSFKRYEIDDSIQEARKSSTEENALELTPSRKVKKVRFFIEDERRVQVDNQPGRKELEELWDAAESGTVFILGQSNVRAKHSSSILKKAAIDLGYDFLQQNCREPDVVLRIPTSSLLTVGMVYVL